MTTIDKNGKIIPDPKDGTPEKTTVIRKAMPGDIDGIAVIYENIHTAEENGEAVTGWIRGIYPERATAQAALERGDLFVCLYGGDIVGSAILNKTQLPEYRGASWKYDLPDEKIMVMHTLVIDPCSKAKGFGRMFEAFYEKYALENGCEALRIDTNSRNIAARRFYEKIGYTEIDIVPCDFNGIKGIDLVLLEKKI